MKTKEREDLKVMLNIISEILNENMIMEFKISSVTEKFRILKLYKLPVEPEKMEEAITLESKWNDLIKEAKKRDKKLTDEKKRFADETKEDVAEFKASLKTLYQDYVSHGPGSPDTSLDEGLELLENFKNQVNLKNKRKEELVLAEKLFNLPISTFKELVQIDESNKKLTVLYEVYAELKSKIQEWGKQLWAKLDADHLKQGADYFEKKKKNLARQGFEEHTVF